MIRDGVHASSVPGYTVARVAPGTWSQIQDWDRVVAASARPSVFLTHDWLVSWWRSFGEGLQPWLLQVVDQEGSTIGLAPLYLEHASPVLPLRVRRLGLIGDRKVGSEYLGLVARAGLENEVGRAVMAHLAAERVTWDVANLIGLVEGDPAGEILEAGLRADAVRIRRERIPCSVIPLPSDFDTYLAGLGSKFRQSYRQRANKLHRTCRVRFYKTESEGELQGHLEALYRLHQARWAAVGHIGSFADAQVRRFYLEVSRRLLRAGRLRFWHLEVDGVIRASQFGFSFGGVMHSLQEGYDSDFRLPGLGGLGVVLRGHVLRSSIEEGLDAYDFLAGTEDFKERWGTSVHYVRSVRMASSGLHGVLAWLATVGAEDLRAALKDMAPEQLLRILRAARLRRNSAGGFGRRENPGGGSHRA
jgi:CelD/BcsL family acetyltransferase involved in cellulose biosynthesis